MEEKCWIINCREITWAVNISFYCIAECSRSRKGIFINVRPPIASEWFLGRLFFFILSICPSKLIFRDTSPLTHPMHKIIRPSFFIRYSIIITWIRENNADAKSNVQRKDSAMKESISIEISLHLEGSD